MVGRDNCEAWAVLESWLATEGLHAHKAVVNGNDPDLIGQLLWTMDGDLYDVHTASTLIYKGWLAPLKKLQDYPKVFGVAVFTEVCNWKLAGSLWQ